MTVVRPKIREVTSADEIKRSARIIRTAFKDVAEQFNLTRQNCPGHTAFLTTRKLAAQKSTERFFGLFLADAQIGFVAVKPPEAPETGAFWIEKLAVLPKYRHNGYGVQLVAFAIDYIKTCGGKKIALGMMDEHTVLKDWYIRLGFRDIGTRKFDYLPLFTVCFMEKDLV